ncbi:hypothetical protein D3C76_1705900 [compost metagenome]
MVGEALQVAALEQILGDDLALAGRHSLDFQAQFDVAADAAPWHQQVFLQHEGNFGDGAVDGFTADQHFAFRGPVQA